MGLDLSQGSSLQKLLSVGLSVLDDSGTGEGERLK